MRLWLTTCLLLLFSLTAQGAPSAQAQREIRYLMDALSQSQCQFQRNGSWYGREEARAHLQRKYESCSSATRSILPNSSLSAPPVAAA